MQENKQDKYEFISEKIKEKPVNKKKLVYHVCFVVLLAVLFGIVASVTFVLCQPKMDDLLHPKATPLLISSCRVTAVRFFCTAIFPSSFEKNRYAT